MKEKWIKWEPIKNLSRKYYLESLVENHDGLKIMLSSAENDAKQILIYFQDSVKAYRKTDESFILLTLHYLGENYGSAFYGNWDFFIVENSEYLNWIIKQSHEIYEPHDFKHYCILASDVMIDIIAGYEPTVQHID